jgi:phosphoenolpyruvate carboxykinase (ATP)
MIDWIELMQNAGRRPESGELGRHGLRNLWSEHWNLGHAQLIEKAIQRNEGTLSEGGALVVRTGQFTGRSPKDKYIVREPGTESTVNWGSVNQPMTPEHFDGMHARMLDFWQDKDVFVRDCLAGADATFQLPVRVIAQRAWHSTDRRLLSMQKCVCTRRCLRNRCQQRSILP